MGLNIRKYHASQQLAAKTRIRAMFKTVSDSIAGMVITSAGSDGTVSLAEARVIRQQARQLIQNLFIALDGSDPYGADGVTPLAPFPRILNDIYVESVTHIVRGHAAWLQKNAPSDVFLWLQTATLNNDAMRQIQQREIDVVTRTDPNFVVSAFTEYDAMHTWVDPNGYRLSDRIWRVADDTRQKLDALLDDMIRQGKSAEQIARLAERFLNPEGANLRTNKPYGRDASYAAMRLARTEISAAVNRAAAHAARLNPYVSGLDIARSRNGDRDCKICPQHATIDIGGNRVREPYPTGGAPIPPFHPHDMCTVVPSVTQTPAEVTRDLQEQLNAGHPAPMTPAGDNLLLYLMLGALF